MVTLEPPPFRPYETNGQQPEVLQAPSGTFRHRHEVRYSPQNLFACALAVGAAVLLIEIASGVVLAFAIAVRNVHG